MSDTESKWLLAMMDKLAAAEREKLELEYHVDTCERLLRCWLSPRGFSDSEDLRLETAAFLEGKTLQTASAMDDLKTENARLRLALAGIQKMTAVADREIADLKTQLANK